MCLRKTQSYPTAPVGLRVSPPLVLISPALLRVLFGYFMQQGCKYREVPQDGKKSGEEKNRFFSFAIFSYQTFSKYNYILKSGYFQKWKYPAKRKIIPTLGKDFFHQEGSSGKGSPSHGGNLPTTLHFVGRFPPLHTCEPFPLCCLWKKSFPANAPD